MYQVLYRKWRPRRFADVVGQPQVTVTLQHELTEGRIAHAYLFTGSRGTGKTTCAKILAKAVNCLNPQEGDPCGECEICRAADDGSLMDIVEIDAASNNGVDNIRSLREEANFTPAAAKYRVYIIDEVHMLSVGAFNALLKTLEEPPPHVIFILATTEVHKLPATILSRCQRFDFRRIPPEDIAQRLHYVAQEEGASIEEDAALLLARLADGALRDALSLLDQCLGRSRTVTEAVVNETAGLPGGITFMRSRRRSTNRDAASVLELIAHLHEGFKGYGASVRGAFLSLPQLDADQDHEGRAESPGGFPGGICSFGKAGAFHPVDYGSALFGHAPGCAGENGTRSGSPHGNGDGGHSPLLTGTGYRFRGNSSSNRGTGTRGTAPCGGRTASFRRTAGAGKHRRDCACPARLAGGRACRTEFLRHAAQPAASTADLAKNAVPLDAWPEILQIMKGYSATISAAFTGSSAYVSGDYVLIDAPREMAFELLRKSSQRGKMRDAIQQVTGRVYKLGPYRARRLPRSSRRIRCFSWPSMAREAGIEVTETKETGARDPNINSDFSLEVVTR